jgi:ribose 1,5-bisphosphokinase
MNIILVVGPSGSGKDTLLRKAANFFARQSTITFARRYITRPPDTNEQNYYIDQLGFLHLEQTGFFLSTWRAHGNMYGIAKHSLARENRCDTVICSISRNAVADFEAQWRHITTILVTADKDVLHQRLLRRKREDEKDIDRRLARAELAVKARNMISFDNSANLEQSSTAFIALLHRLHLGRHEDTAQSSLSLSSQHQ